MGLDEIFRALADPTRRRILQLLRNGDLAASEIAAAFPLALSTLSGHLKVLKESGLVVTERQGTRIVYSLNTGLHEELLGAVLELLRVGHDVPEPATRKDPDAHHVAS